MDTTTPIITAVTRNKLITEEWMMAWSWLGANPGNYGPPELFPTLDEWIENYVPKFTDSVALLINDEIVAIGLLDEEAFIHCLLNPDCQFPLSRARHLKKAFERYFIPRYKFLYTEMTSSNEKAEKLVKFLGFSVLPQSITHPRRKVAVYMKR